VLISGIFGVAETPVVRIETRYPSRIIPEPAHPEVCTALQHADLWVRGVRRTIPSSPEVMKSSSASRAPPGRFHAVEDHHCLPRSKLCNLCHIERTIWMVQSPENRAASVVVVTHIDDQSSLVVPIH
jgi:hypothetical protein